jgi:hypothetical protein
MMKKLSALALLIAAGSFTQASASEEAEKKEDAVHEEPDGAPAPSEEVGEPSAGVASPEDEEAMKKAAEDAAPDGDAASNSDAEKKPEKESK